VLVPFAPITSRRLRCVALAAVPACAGPGRPAATPAPTSTVETLLERHVAAIGGRAALDSIRSLQIIGILNERGTLHPLFIDQRRPNQLRVRMMHDGQVAFTEVYTGMRSWEGPPGRENCAPADAAAAATRHAAEQFDDGLISLRARGATPRAVGRERIGSRQAYRVDVTERDGSVRSYYLDETTYLLLRARDRRPLHPDQPERVIEVAYEDYRPVAGVLYPFRVLERDLSSYEPLTLMRVDWMEANVPVNEGAFALPPRCR
jgi:hypothetical protein